MHAHPLLLHMSIHMPVHMLVDMYIIHGHVDTRVYTTCTRASYRQSCSLSRVSLHRSMLVSTNMCIHTCLRMATHMPKTVLPCTSPYTQRTVRASPGPARTRVRTHARTHTRTCACMCRAPHSKRSLIDSQGHSDFFNNTSLNVQPAIKPF